MEMNAGVRDRIFSAADEIYAEKGNSEYPTVDAVRKRARVNMNDASLGMREWRRKQTTQFTPVTAQLPAELQHSVTAATAALWTEATRIANESLRTAQAGWETERAEAEDLARQMAEAYDRLTSDLEAVTRGLEAAQTENEALRRSLHAAQLKLTEAEHENVELNQASKASELRANTESQRSEDLRRELDRARQELTTARAEHASFVDKNSEQVDALRREGRRDLERERERTDALRAALDEARADSVSARKELSTLQASHIQHIERLRVDAKQELDKERARAEREIARLQALLTVSAPATKATVGNPRRRSTGGAVPNGEASEKKRNS